MEQNEELSEVVDRNRVQEWIKGAFSVLDAIDQKGRTNLLKKNFKVPGDPAVYIEVIKELAKNNRKHKFEEFFVPTAEPHNIVDALADTFKEEGAFDKSYSKSVDIMIKVSKNWPWTNLLQSLEQRVSAQNALATAEIVGCVECLMNITYTASNTEAKKCLEQMSNNGTILHLLHHAKKNPEAVAACIFPMLDFNPKGNETPQPVGNSAQGHSMYQTILNEPENHPEVVDYLGDYFVKYNKVEDLLNKPSDTANTKSLVKSVLDIIVHREDVSQNITSKTFIEEYETFKDYLETPVITSLIKKLASEQDLLSELCNEPFDVERSDLYLIAFTSGKNQAFTDFLKDGLSNISKAIWTEQLKNEGNLLHLLLHLIDQNVNLDLSTDYEDALLLNADNIITGKARIKNPLNKSDNILSVLTKASRKTFLRTLRDKLVEKSSNDAIRLLDYYGEQLIVSGVLEEDADEIVRRLFSNILSRRNKAELEWVQTVIEKRPNIKNCKSETKGSFRERLESTLREVQLTDETRPFIEKIAIEFDVDPTMHKPEPEPEPEDETTSEEEADEEEETKVDDENSPE